jgi:TPP-dependent pyruvate/acetoin dehydrogenase alpha subunit
MTKQQRTQDMSIHEVVIKGKAGGFIHITNGKEYIGMLSIRNKDTITDRMTVAYVDDRTNKRIEIRGYD